MTATDELRRMLDERGVEWEMGRTAETIVRKPFDASFAERLDGRMRICFRSYLTPEQAIEATLGRGTCRNTQSDFDFMCSECGKCVDNGRVLGFNFCPNCGRRVVAGDAS